MDAHECFCVRAARGDRPATERDRRARGARHHDRRAFRFEHRAQLLGDGEHGVALVISRGTGRADRWMTGIDRDDAARKRVRRVDDRRVPDAQHEISALPEREPAEARWRRCTVKRTRSDAACSQVTSRTAGSFDAKFTMSTFETVPYSVRMSASPAGST